VKKTTQIFKKLTVVAHKHNLSWNNVIAMKFENPEDTVDSIFILTKLRSDRSDSLIAKTVKRRDRIFRNFDPSTRKNSIRS
jgi:SUMO ligase MMS21 Smc5/6 complex component